MRFTGRQLFETKSMSVKTKWRHRWFSKDWWFVDISGQIQGYVGLSEFGWYVPLTFRNGLKIEHRERFYDRKTAMVFVEKVCSRR